MCLSVFIIPGLLATVPTSQFQSCNTLNPLSVQKDFKTSPSSETKWETSPGDEMIGHSPVICDEDMKNGIQLHRYKSWNTDECEWRLTIGDRWVSAAVSKTWVTGLVSVYIFLQTLYRSSTTFLEKDELCLSWALYCIDWKWGFVNLPPPPKFF